MRVSWLLWTFTGANGRRLQTMWARGELSIFLFRSLWWLWTQPWEGREAGHNTAPGEAMLCRVGQMLSCGAASLPEPCQVRCR